jgi:hypothetical protein
MYSAFNLIAAPKRLLISQDTGHWTYAEQREEVETWLINKLKGIE